MQRPTCPHTHTNLFRRSQLQSNTDYQEGKFDLDGLCSELRNKARCSESGVLVDQNHVDAALKKLSAQSAGSGAVANAGAVNDHSPVGDPDYLMFEQKSCESN